MNEGLESFLINEIILFPGSHCTFAEIHEKLKKKYNQSIMLMLIS